MKKLLALVLALAMMLCMGTALAVDPEETPATSTSAYYQTGLVKTYTDVVAKENIEFTTADDPTKVENVDHAGYKAGTDPYPTVTLTKAEDEANFTLVATPDFQGVGDFYYTVTEEDAGTEGVKYEKSAYTVHVQRVYNEDRTAINTAIVIYQADTTNGKVKDLVNDLQTGSLSVKKLVTGSLADQKKPFVFTITFKANDDDVVRSDIDVALNGEALEPIVGQGEANNWTEKTYEISLAHKDEIVFTHIPAGVTYTVSENPDTYDLIEENYSDSTKSIANEDEDTVVFTNELNATVNTGINMDSMPYIVLMGLVVLAGVALILKKRTVND